MTSHPVKIGQKSARRVNQHFHGILLWGYQQVAETLFRLPEQRFWQERNVYYHFVGEKQRAKCHIMADISHLENEWRSNFWL